ncbi:ligand-gated channel protein [Mannheimia granulomatis]|uniref:TonB-dependent receptor n=1 Tax=Mannheimia granulomatis TaxID=85402 RepID=UPI00159D2CD9|nr:TonB-dependent receptor plug domain-containing protein [Mannheimia granulomatis]QLB14613.1 ligand-gated channel protein [Mannheimia granulomatis]
MKFKHNPFYLALFMTTPLLSAQEAAVLDEVEVKATLETLKAAENVKADVDLSLLGRQLAFTSPITVIHYDEQAFAEKSLRNVVDALAKTDASVMNFGGETNTLGGIYVRGLQLDARQFSVNGLAGLYGAYNTAVSAVGSAQVIKGASTATVGMDPEGSAGASVNIETKRASDEPINKIGLAWFGNNRLQPSFDLARRFGANNEWGIRVSGLYRDGNTPRHGYSELAKEIAVGADYRSDKLRVGLDYFQTKRAANGGRARLQDLQNLAFNLPLAPNGKINLVPEWSKQTTDDETAMLTFEYDLPAAMMLSGGIGHMESKYYGSFTQLKALDTQGKYSAENSTAMDFRSRTTSGNLKLQGQFETGVINHYWSVAYDRVQRQRDHDSNPTNARVGKYTTNFYHPNFSEAPNHQGIVQAADNQFTAQSVALSDTLGIWEDHIRLTLGGRFQWIEQLNRTTSTRLKADRFSPMVAAAFVPNEDLVFYTNHLEDLEPGNADPDTGEMNSPRVTRQLEAGVRKNWDDRLTTTFSVYELSRPGIIRGNKAVLKARAGKEQGKERNRGVELNVYANLLDKTLRPSLGVSYNQGKVFDFPTYADTIVSGVQVTSPRWIVKGAMEWDTPFVPNLTLNAGIQHYGKSYQDTAAQYKLPSYTTVDLGAKYTLKWADKQSLTLRAGVENLFNKHYWQVQRGQYDRSFAVVGMPRTYWTKAEFSF